jgi:hypothetical protein
MKIEQIACFLDFQFGVQKAELVLESNGILFFKGIDVDFRDGVEARVHKEGLSVYTRMEIDGYDIDFVGGESDEYRYQGVMMEPIRAEIIA